MIKKEIKRDRLGEILEAFFIRLGWSEKILEAKAIDYWTEVVGKEIAEKTQPFRVRNGVLQVRVPNSVWMQELHFFKNHILQKLNQRLKERNPQALPLKDLKFFLGEVKVMEYPRIQTGRDFPAQELTLNEKEKIHQAVAFIKDPELREVFQRFFSRGLEAEKSKR